MDLDDASRRQKRPLNFGGDEAIKSSKRSNKTTYFFQPVNNLTSKPAANKVHTTDPIQKVLKPTDLNTTTTEIPYKTREEVLEIIVPEHQSSDDSFEGIRWKASPRKFLTDKIPSSPLKNVLPSTKESPKDQTIYPTEHSPSKSLTLAFQKFGTGTTQAPGLNRTYSDISSTESKHKKSHPTSLKSPTLNRARSGGLDKLISSKSSLNIRRSEKPSSNTSALKSWMDKFETLNLSQKEFTSPPVSRFEDKELESSSVSRSDHKVEPNQPESHKTLQTNHESINNLHKTKEELQQPQPEVSSQFSDFSSEISINPVLQRSTPKKTAISENISDESDPFSDDDDEILAALELTTKLNAHVSTTTSISTITPPSGELINNCESSDDPFTDDDSELMQVIGIPKGLSAKCLEPKQILTSQAQRDMKHTKSFQNSIKKFEQLQLQERNRGPKNVNAAELSFNRPNLQRYQINSILEKSYGIKSLRKQLLLDVSDSKQETLKLIVRGEYCELELSVGDVIHVIITDTENPKLIDDTHNLLILNPDVLMNATAVAQQILCPRKSVLLGRYKFPGSLSVPLVVGEIVHTIFQECFIQEKWTTTFMIELMEMEIEKYLITIFSMGPEVEHVREEIMKHLPYLEYWFNTYYKKPLSKLNFIPTTTHNENVMFSVNNALDIEESIWSPMFGLRGKVDVTLESKLLNNNTSGKFLLPMEIKTGREYLTHLAQASLYALLFKDRYDMELSSFLLVYTKDKLTKKCDISPTDLKSLINLRNKVSKFHQGDSRALPPLLKSAVCDRCDVQGACMTINKLMESGESGESGIPENIYIELTKHLDNNQVYQDFFNYWDDLLAKEDSIMKKTMKYLWTLTAKQREETDGLALSEMVLMESDDLSDDQRQFLYTFGRSVQSQNRILESQMNKGDRVIISDESGHFAIAQGTIQSISYDKIQIFTYRRIISSDMKLDNFDKSNNQVFHGVLRRTATQSTKTFRIDKDEMYYGSGIAKYNILNLFMTDGDSKRRRAIVDLEKPTFSETSLPHDTTGGGFNPDQLKAFDKVLSCNDYSLILGMPGTGKTTVIAELIKYIVDNGKTVLLASFTHSAVDTILLKVKDFGINILRVGYPTRVHKDIRPFIPKTKEIKNYSDFSETYMNPPVVASTCLGISDITFNMRTKFDYCIIDEASQVSMPISLGPLRYCDKFVLVGDHLQLPPLVQHPNPAVKRGLSQSLFKILADAHPHALVELTYQYRMCDEIMQLSNVLVYNNRLKCGSAEVANQKLIVPEPQNIEKHLGTHIDVKETDLWLHKILEEENKVMFLDHDRIPAVERLVGDKVENHIEADLVQQIVEGLLSCGVEESKIGVMSFNRAQLRLLEKKLSTRKEIEVLTADQYQGRDKDCIIISLVRSNTQNNPGDLVKEWRRVNVAITRARSKLIILGSRSTLSSADTISSFIDLLDDRGWIYEMPENSHKFYNFVFSSQLLTSTQRPSKLIKPGTVTNDILNEMR